MRSVITILDCEIKRRALEKLISTSDALSNEKNKRFSIGSARIICGLSANKVALRIHVSQNPLLSQYPNGNVSALSLFSKISPTLTLCDHRRSFLSMLLLYHRVILYIFRATAFVSRLL